MSPPHLLCISPISPLYLPGVKGDLAAANSLDTVMHLAARSLRLPTLRWLVAQDGMGSALAAKNAEGNTALQILHTGAVLLQQLAPKGALAAADGGGKGSKGGPPAPPKEAKVKGLAKKGKKGKGKKQVDAFSKKDWYDIKAPSAFQVRNVGKTLVTRSSGMRVATDYLNGRIVEANLADLNKDEDQKDRKSTRLNSSH